MSYFILGFVSAIIIVIIAILFYFKNGGYRK